MKPYVILFLSALSVANAAHAAQDVVEHVLPMRMHGVRAVTTKHHTTKKHTTTTKHSTSHHKTTTSKRKTTTSTRKNANAVQTGNKKVSKSDAWTGSTSLKSAGSLKVGAMQLAVVGQNSVVILDKAEDNPGRVAGHAGWGQWLNVATGKSTILNVKTNSFCAGGTFLSNGTLVAMGGNPTYDAKEGSDYGDLNGQQAVRVFPKCDDSSCSIYENPSRLRLSGGRWYPSLARLSDGSVFVTSGTIDGTFIGGENTTLVNYSHEYWPSKDLNNGLPIYSPFLEKASPSFLFPITYYLPNDFIFMAASTYAMQYDWRNDKEHNLPDLNAKVNYPWTAPSAMLSLTPANNYTPDILICGGSTQNDKAKPKTMTASMPTVNTCQRMTMSTAGIAGGWQTETMPSGRLMGQAVLLPDGKVLLVNGAKTGVSGFKNIGKMVGYSNADNPVYQPWLYDSNAAKGSRFSTAGMPTSKHARMYHSVASLLPNGQIIIAGSNPNPDSTPQSSKYPYYTDYSYELLSPPYMSMTRPTISKAPSKLGYGSQFTLSVTLPSGTQASDVVVNLVEIGYKTHGLAFDQRLVQLVVNSVSADGKTLSVTGPPSNKIYPPGVGYIFALAAGVPSVGQRVMVGDGSDPPFSKSAYNNMIKTTGTDGNYRIGPNGRVLTSAYYPPEDNDHAPK